MNVVKQLAAVTCTLGLLLTIGTTAMAHDGGDILVRVGAGTVFTNTDSDAVTGIPDGVDNARVDVDDNTQLSLTATYMMSEHLGFELLAATPFSHFITGDEQLDGVDIGKTKHLPPTLTAQWNFGRKDARFNPYVGLGFNYTIFFDETVSQDLIDTLNTLPTVAGLGGVNSVDMDLSDSFGLAGVVGMDVMVAENIFINAALWYICIETEATLKTDLGTTHKSDVTLDPLVFNLAVGFTF
ncbi:MAG: OmpW family outer membrane protein [Thermodesulfobacteriota bacterium]